MTDVLSKVPGTRGYIEEARELQAESDAQAAYNDSRATNPNQSQPSFDAPPGSAGGPPSGNIPGTNMDPQTVIKKIYPILVFQ